MKKILYGKRKDQKISYAEITTRKIRNKEEYKVKVKKGVLDSKSISEKEYIVKSKSKAESKFNRLSTVLINKGYINDLETIKKRKYNLFPDNNWMPMLLNKATEKKLDNIKYPCYAQFKYDGMRCTTQLNKSVELRTRENNPIGLQHVVREVTDIINTQLSYPLDGELYIHEKDLGDQTSIYKEGDTGKEYKYVIYDIPFEGLSFDRRRNLMMSIDIEKYNHIDIDYGTQIDSKKELIKFYNKALSNGYEGVVVCDPTGTYEFGFRSDFKLKMKPRETAEFKCTGHYFNSGKMSKQSTLICETAEGRKFHVKMKGTDEQREKYATEFEEKFKDKMITVEFRKLSKYGVPIEAVGICVRDYE